MTSDIKDERLRGDLDFYLSQPEEWKVRNVGKFVLIKNREICGIFENYKDALQEGIKLFGGDGFLLHEIGSENVVHYNTFSLLGVT